MSDPAGGALPWLIDRLTRLIGASTDALEAEYPAGVSAWQQELSRQLARYTAASYMAGADVDDLDDAGTAQVQQDLAIQLKFLGNFETAVRDGKRWQNGWNARAAMYAQSIKTPYWHGRTRMLPLPAMPAEGTQCRTYCGCYWEVVTVDEEKGHYDAYWRRGKDDSCQTCRQRAADWSPLQIRGGVLQLDGGPAPAEPAPEQPEPTAPDVAQMIRDKEDQIRPQRFESAYGVMPDGRVVVDKDGERYSVRFSDDEIKAMRGAIFTHNHPRGWDVPENNPERQGNSFSPEDIDVACSAQLAEIRAVTPKWRYSMKPPEGGWNEDYWKTIVKPEYDAAESVVYKAFGQAIQAGTMSIDEARANHYHSIWTRVSERLGLVYTREES